jgi:hypothetical protein
VSLSGTFETLSVTDVFSLLAVGRKTGALKLEADGLEAVVMIADGMCCAVEPGPPDTDTRQLATHLRDVAFEISRAPHGRFGFDADHTPTDAQDLRVDLEEVAREVEGLVDAWAEVEEVVPSLEHRPSLHRPLATGRIELDADHWDIVVASTGRQSVRQIAELVVRPAIEVCRDLCDLVDAGAVVIGDPRSRPTADAPVDSDAPRPLIEPREPYGPGVSQTLEAVNAIASHEPAPALPSVPIEAIVEPSGMAGDDVPAPAPPPPPPPLPEAVVEATVDEAALPETVAEMSFEVGSEEDESTDPKDRGALLRMFAALRDS